MKSGDKWLFLEATEIILFVLIMNKKFHGEADLNYFLRFDVMFFAFN